MPTDPSLDGKEIIVGITGGIACYKVADLVSKLVQCGANVQVLMTEAATKFVSPLTFSSLSGNAVFDSQWSFVEGHDPQHIRIAKKTDLMLIAPCTMNMLAKLAVGMTNDPVSLGASAIDRSVTPVLIAPAMNATMINQPATQRNLELLSKDTFIILPSEDGWQACKTIGLGRMPEPNSLLNAIKDVI